MSQSENYWRSFPHMEALFKEGQLEPFLRQCEQSCTSLDQLVRDGDERDAEKARAAMTAYGHTLQLLDQLAIALAGGDDQRPPR